MSSSPIDSGESLPPRLASVFVPVDPRALGIAAGLVLGGLVALLTVFHVVVQPEHAPDVGLLAQYFYGYSVSWPGVAIGLMWGTITGLVTGWFAGFTRNRVMRLRLLMVRTRANLTQPFLDDLS